MSPAARVLIVPVTLYRWLVSPVLGCNCRYCPSCSEYAIEALRRIGRCHPWGGYGYDPVPPRAGGR